MTANDGRMGSREEVAGSIMVNPRRVGFGFYYLP